MSLLGPKQFLHRKSCNGIQLRLGICEGYSYLTIERPGQGRRRLEIPDDKIDAIEIQFHSIGDDPKRFLEFVDTMAPAERLWLR